MIRQISAPKFRTVPDHVKRLGYWLITWDTRGDFLCATYYGITGKKSYHHADKSCEKAICKEDRKETPALLEPNQTWAIKGPGIWKAVATNHR